MVPNLHGAAQKIADKLDFNIVITSGVRDAKQQAMAMFNKIISANSTQILLDDYKDDTFAQGVIDAWNNGKNLEQATTFVQAYYETGKGSNHFNGEALDIRTTGGDSNRLNETQIAEVIEVTKSLGFTPYREYYPPHIHVKVGSGHAIKKNLYLLALAGMLLWIYTK